MNWSGLKPGADWVQEAFCLSGGRVSEGLHSAFVFLVSFSAVRAALSVSYRSLQHIGRGSDLHGLHATADG